MDFPTGTVSSQQTGLKPGSTKPSRTIAKTGWSGFLFAVLAALRAADDLGHKALREAGDETPEE